MSPISLSRRQALAGGAIGSVAALLALAGCSTDSADASGRLLTIPREDMGTFTRNFNPFSPNNAPMTAQAVYEPMLIFNPVRGDTVPWLAESWETAEDGMSITFHLRQDVTWSDGNPLIAQDVVTTFDVQLKTLGGYDYLDTVSAGDDHTVVFKFSRPYSVALYELGQQLVTPDHVWSKIADPAKDTNENPVGTGPFTEIANFQAQSYDLMPNPNYWQKEKVKIPGIRMLAFAGNDGANLAAVNGDVDWAPQYMADIQTAYVDKDPEHRHYWFPGIGSTIQWTLNTTKAPFNDPAFRKAVSQAVDREAVCQTGMSGYASPIDPTGMGDGFADWKDPESLASPLCTYDVSAAEKALDAAGYVKGADGRRSNPDGSELSFSISVGSTSSDWLSVAQIIVQNLADVGITATVDSPDWSEVTSVLENGSFDTAVCWSSVGATPYTYYQSALSEEKVRPVGEQAFENYHRFGDAEATALLAEFAATFDEAEQKEICKRIQARFLETWPVIPLFPGPEWGAYTDVNFIGWPTEDNDYASLATRSTTTVLILTSLEPRA
ncbi:ABC transporter substrate-binding protein [Actinomyces sp.]|uniref:ABC transporter substrate-binding protein n=1 Tax=Actinomyces sp. TaxID=29317 RepID=UPI0026DAD9D7|nr:ABC transporter substrate-binding protein [Actinomyces sp.]MDO4899219.1 ABC transporter substrate-binding protein [Actinomyces sp.]